MILDELVVAIVKVSPGATGIGLAHEIWKWQASAETVADLERTFSDSLSRVRFESPEIHDAVHSLWSAFRENEIQSIAGMTMNERLFVFGIMERFDRAGPAEQNVIYAKLHARR